MYNEDMKYTREHEWIRVTKGEAIIGITDYAQNEMGDVVYVEVPEIGKKVKKGDILATLESVKAVSEVYAPISGEVIKVNEDLNSTPELINEDAHGKGWIAVIKWEKEDDFQDLMTAAEYEGFLKDGE